MQRSDVKFEARGADAADDDEEEEEEEAAEEADEPAALDGTLDFLPLEAGIVAGLRKLSVEVCNSTRTRAHARGKT